jgi:hypothetical protein
VTVPDVHIHHSVNYQFTKALRGEDFNHILSDHSTFAICQSRQHQRIKKQYHKRSPSLKLGSDTKENTTNESDIQLILSFGPSINRASASISLTTNSVPVE